MGHRNNGIDVYVVEDAIMHLPHLDSDPNLSKTAIYDKWSKVGVQRIQSTDLDSILATYRGDKGEHIETFKY
jgi:hypothetical protein